MSAVATAVVGGAVIGAVASNRASSTQARAANKATNVEKAMFDIARSDQTPFRNAGYNALDDLGFLLGLDADGFRNGLPANATAAEKAAYDARIARLKSNPNYNSLMKPFTGANLQNEPGYKFGLQQGMRGLENSATARGGLLSGAALKAASRYNQDYAGTKYNEAFNRDNINKTNTFNRLASLSGVGQTAASQIGTQAMQAGQSIGNNVMAAGNARASGYVGGANAITGAIGTGVNMWQQNQLMNSYSPNFYGRGSNPYAGYNAAANGGWGIE